MFIQGAKVTWFKDIQRLHRSEGFHGLFWTFSCTYHSLCCIWCMNRRRHGKEPSQRLRFVVVWWFLWCENQFFKNTRLWNKLVSFWERPASAILVYCCLTQAIILLWFIIVVDQLEVLPNFCWSSTYRNRCSNLGLIADARSMHYSIILMGGKGGQWKPSWVSNKKTLDSDTPTQSARNSCWKPPIPRSCLQRNMPPLAQAWAPLKWPSCVRQCLGNSQVRWIRCHDKPRLMGVAPSNFLVYTYCIQYNVYIYI